MFYIYVQKEEKEITNLNRAINQKKGLNMSFKLLNIIQNTIMLTAELKESKTQLKNLRR